MSSKTKLLELLFEYKRTFQTFERGPAKCDKNRLEYEMTIETSTYEVKKRSSFSGRSPLIMHVTPRPAPY